MRTQGMSRFPIVVILLLLLLLLLPFTDYGHRILVSVTEPANREEPRAAPSPPQEPLPEPGFCSRAKKSPRNADPVL